jgi:tetratricopeptide (TPR) repeat protein
LKFITSIRASLLLGKGHKLLESGRYQEALAKAEQASKLQLEEQSEWLCHVIEGKSRYHLGDPKNALLPLQQAQAILLRKLETESASKPLQNILDDVTDYLEKIEQHES